MNPFDFRLALKGGQIFWSGGLVSLRELSVFSSFVRGNPGGPYCR